MLVCYPVRFQEGWCAHPIQLPASFLCGDPHGLRATDQHWNEAAPRHWRDQGLVAAAIITATTAAEATACLGRIAMQLLDGPQELCELRPASAHLDSVTEGKQRGRVSTASAT
eukprot:1136551-Pelagomonas_calceolata.AAC.9